MSNRKHFEEIVKFNFHFTQAPVAMVWKKILKKRKSSIQKMGGKAIGFILEDTIEEVDNMERSG